MSSNPQRVTQFSTSLLSHHTLTCTLHIWQTLSKLEMSTLFSEQLHSSVTRARHLDTDSKSDRSTVEVLCDAEMRWCLTCRAMMICWLVWSWEFCCCNSCLRFTTSFFRASSLTYHQHDVTPTVPHTQTINQHNMTYYYNFTATLMTLCEL